jgi:C1A family cysteine protease
MTLSARLATAEDVEGMMRGLGVRVPGDIYEPVVIDGFGTGLAPRTSGEWQLLVGNLTVFEVETLSEDLPSSFDFSADPEFPAVGNQGAQGSCAAWAATYYSYGYMEAVDLGWNEAASGNASQLLSPAWTYNMVNGGMERGSWMDTNMMVVRDWGVSTLAAMPYDDSDYTSWGSAEAFREAPSHRASQVGYLAYDPASTVEAIKALVVAGTPVSFAMDANEFTPGFGDSNYILSSAEYSSTTLNHAQTIVGFDDALSDDSDTGAFRVVNSWGDEWGDAGYYWFTYAALSELGTLGVLTSNFIVDMVDYDPSLVGVWHFDAAPSRSASITVGVGSSPDPDSAKIPFFDGGFHSKDVFPSFMCLDMTELAGVFWSEGGMHLSVGDAMDDGVVSSFKVESYEPSFVPGKASQASEQSADVPAGTPASVSAFLEYYEPLSAGEAMECPSLAWSSSGQATWVAVDHHSSSDGDSMQTGDVSDGAYSRLEAEVEGPVRISFDWMVSSEAGADVLSFAADGVTLDQISGDVEWTGAGFDLAAGPHVVTWLYAKDGSASALGDAGWVDAVTVSSTSPAPPSIALEDSYSVLLDVPTVFSPSSLEYPPESTLTVWYDWGDATPWSMATVDEDFSATHTYSAEGDYTLAAHAVDEWGSNVSDSALVRVTAYEPNEVPSVSAVAGLPDGGYALPGAGVSFEVFVTDAEGGTITVACQFGDGSADASLSQDMVAPGEEVSFAFSHVYSQGSDTPYALAVTAMDADEHPGAEWDVSVQQVLVNSPPTASLLAEPLAAFTAEEVAFNASGSSDAETDAQTLMYRWDWTGDGEWDTGWSADAEVEWAYLVPGTFEARVEVMDGAGLTSSVSATVSVTGSAIPEFSALVVPVVAVLVIFLAVRSSARRKGG